MLSTSSAYVTTSATSVVITSLSNGLVHYFAVEAKNLWGSNPFSAITTTSLPNALPSPSDDLIILKQQHHRIHFDVLANDSDADGDALKVVEVFNVSGGSADISTDGSAVIMLTTTATLAPVSFHYTVEDIHGGRSTAVASTLVGGTKLMVVVTLIEWNP